VYFNPQGGSWYVAYHDGMQRQRRSLGVATRPEAEAAVKLMDDPPSAAHLSPPMTTLRQPLVELGQARGEVRNDIPSDALSHFVLRSILGALRDWGLGADDRDRETALNYALTLVFDAIGTRP